MYLSPEMLDPEGVDQRCDIYGIGLLLYELVTDKPAYMAKNINQLYEKIKANQINFDLPSLKGDVKDLLQKILVADPEKRISIEEIKKHPYFHDISFLKVYKKEYGPIITKKKDKSEINENDPQKLFSKNILQGGNEEEEKKKEITEDEDIKKEKKSEDEFKEQQKKLDANKEYSFLDGKISVREMKKDQKRAMKNYVREFYYVKKKTLLKLKNLH
jgi:serine/threonine protein kinase